MLHGDVIPHRFGERLVDGKKQYDAITHIHYIGPWAFAVGLTDTLKPSHISDLLERLYARGVRRFHYWSDEEMVIWQLYETKGKIRGRLIEKGSYG